MIAMWLAACAADSAFTDDEWDRLRGLALEDPALPPPSADNGVAEDPAAIELGRLLYTDEGFSNPEDGGVRVSCDTCHDLCLDKGCAGPLDGDPSGADLRGEPVSRGADGSTARNSPSVLNTVLRAEWSWVGKFDSLDDQILFPISSAGAYNADDPAIVVDRLAVAWRAPYEAVFGALDADPECEDDPKDCEDALRAVERNVAFALEAFLRTLVVADTPFDRHLDHEDVLTPAQERGARLFVGRGHCVECHVGPLLSDGLFHSVGVPGDDRGRADATGLDEDLGQFQTPSLRGVANTGPFMHDGSIRSLWQVLEHYNVGGQRDGVLGEVDPRIRPLGLSDADLDDLEQFLEALGPS